MVRMILLDMLVKEVGILIIKSECWFMFTGISVAFVVLNTTARKLITMISIWRNILYSG